MGTQMAVGSQRLKIGIIEGHREIVRLLALCVLVGIVAGLGAVAFYYLLKSADFVFMDYLAGYRPNFAGHEEPIFRTDSATSPPCAAGFY